MFPRPRYHAPYGMGRKPRRRRLLGSENPRPIPWCRGPPPRLARPTQAESPANQAGLEKQTKMVRLPAGATVPKNARPPRLSPSLNRYVPREGTGRGIPEDLGL